MTDRPFRHLCPEADARDAMDDGEFWAHVAKNLGAIDAEEFPVDGDDLRALGDAEPCEVCGETGACGYDAEGRPMIHATAEEPSP